MKRRYFPALAFGIALGVLLAPLELWRSLAVFAVLVAAVGVAVAYRD